VICELIQLEECSMNIAVAEATVNVIVAQPLFSFIFWVNKKY